MQIWTNEEKGNEKIIAYIDQTIYRGNPKSSEIDSCIYDLKMRKIPPDSFVGIPLHYLKEINIQEGKEYIEILFGGDSYEHFRIKDQNRRTEIFNYFKANIPNVIFSVDKYSKVKAGKKPLIAMAVVGLLFLWVFFIAKGMESGNSYEVVGEQHSLASIVLLIASLGVNKILLIFASLFAIAVIAFIKRAKNPPLITRLTIKR
jgi:hypothetical protein